MINRTTATLGLVAIATTTNFALANPLKSAKDLTKDRADDDRKHHGHHDTHTHAQPDDGS